MRPRQPPQRIDRDDGTPVAPPSRRRPTARPHLSSQQRSRTAGRRHRSLRAPPRVRRRRAAPAAETSSSSRADWRAVAGSGTASERVHDRRRRSSHSRLRIAGRSAGSREAKRSAVLRRDPRSRRGSRVHNARSPPTTIAKLPTAAAAKPLARARCLVATDRARVRSEPEARCGRCATFERSSATSSQAST